MNVYSQDRPCPKCGAERFWDDKFCERGAVCWPLPDGLYGRWTKTYEAVRVEALHKEPRIHRKCGRCGFAVDEAPLDASPEARQTIHP